jgi:hypothetical protein
MKKSLLEIYALSICFVSALTVLVGLATAADALIGIIAPSVMTTLPYNEQTNDNYWGTARLQTFDQNTKVYGPRPSEEKLTQMRLAAIEQQNENTRLSSIQTAIKSGLMIIIAAIFFAFHWQIAKRQREQEAKA